MDPDSLSKAFVEHYYSTFDTNRGGLANLYQDSSMLTFEASNIVTKLTSLPFQQCKHSITTVDCQPSGPAVSGNLQLAGEQHSQTEKGRSIYYKTEMGDLDPRSSLRCRHCAGPLTKEMETSAWTVGPLIRDSFSMIGSAVGGVASAFYGFNLVMPVVQRRVKGPMWLHFLIGAPPVIVFSSACAGLAGGAIPAVAQLASSSYHAAVSSPTTTRDDKINKSNTSNTL